MRIIDPLKDQWDFLNKCSVVLFRRDYFALPNNQRLAVHLSINDTSTPGHKDLVNEGLMTSVPGIHNGSWGGYPMQVVG